MRKKELDKLKSQLEIARTMLSVHDIITDKQWVSIGRKIARYHAALEAKAKRA